MHGGRGGIIKIVTGRISVPESLILWLAMLLYGLFISRYMAGAIVCQSLGLGKIFVDGFLNLSPLAVMTQSLTGKKSAPRLMRLDGEASRLMRSPIRENCMPMLRQLLPGLLMFWILTIPCRADDMSEYLTALQAEINNRAVASAVVPVLAQRTDGTAKGSFWAAYAALEQQQKPLYLHHQTRHELDSGGVGVWFKSNGSLLAAWIHHDGFVEKLAQATETYLAKVNAVTVPESEQAFWDYVVEQEAAQVEALALAAQGQYRLAAMRLRAFMEQANDRLP